MAKDNYFLGEFELKDIPPAPRGIPQIEVSFSIDMNNTLTASATDKGTGKSISFTYWYWYLLDRRDEEIDRMIVEAETFAEEDQQAKEVRMHIYDFIISALKPATRSKTICTLL
jgi:heat shock protein 5